MQRVRFSMKRRLKFTNEGKARRWFALCLLPLLWMSIVANAPHDHDLEELAVPHAARSTPLVSEAQLAPVAHDDHEHGCLLCAWASVATAWLQIALALSVPAALIALFSLPLFPVLSPTTRFSNSRAPPQLPNYS